MGLSMALNANNAAQFCEKLEINILFFLTNLQTDLQCS